LYVIGVDKTQSIALDEIFGKKSYADYESRASKVYRKTRITTVVGSEQENKLSYSKKESI
jgi:hypothetical protein